MSAKKRSKMAKATKKNPTPRRRDYTVHVAQEDRQGLTLWAFSSKELVQPTASALQYQLLLKSAARGGTTHVFTSDAQLKKFLNRDWSGKKIARGRIREANPRNSKVKDALAAEATRFTKFEDFARAYWDACSRGLYWIATNEKRFYIGEHERKQISAGKFNISCSPNLALTGKNEGKKYVAELDVTRVPGDAIRIKRGMDGAEIKITGAAGSVKVTRVLEADKATRAFKWQLSILPSSKEELRQVWESAWKERRKEDARRTVRRKKEKEREEKRAEMKSAQDKRAAQRRKKKIEREAKRKKVTREAEGRQARKATEPKAAKKKETKKKAPTKKAAKKKATKKKAGTWKRVPASNPSSPSDVARKIPAHINNPGC